MNIKDASKILKTQIETERTPKGRPLTKEAVLNLDAALSDEKNLGNDAVECIGCGMVQSKLLVIEGCANCGCVELKVKGVLSKKENIGD
jgi:hypothetical protein